MTEKTLTTENIKPALDALRGELAPWPVVAMKQDKLNDTQKSAVNSGITSGLVAQIIANTAAIRALESAITGTGLRALVVASLPAIGTQGILYIVPVTTYDPATDADVVNYSNEYIWIVAPDAPVTEGYYEQVGQTGIVINNGQLTITVNGTSVGTFTANQSGDTTAAITVPTNADYVDLTTDQTVAGVKAFSSTIDGTASKAIADEDGTSIKTGYVNIAGNQTVSGQKTWSGNQFFNSDIYHRNTTYELGNTPASNVVIPVYFVDKNNAYTGYVRNVVLASGKTQTELQVRNKFANGALSPTGTDVTSTLQVEVQPNGTKTIYWDGLIRNDVTPFTTNNNSLGSSTNQWSSVYAQTYYYNGTKWGLDQANVWSSLNTFQKGIYLAGDRQAYVCPMWNGAQSGLALLTQNKTVFIGNYTDDASSRKVLDTSKGSIRIFAGESNNENTAIIEPANTINSQLGTSTNKWKTLNGINPGALSLPSSGYVEIDTTNWDLTGASSQSYTPAVPGWLFVSIQNIAGNYLSISGRGAVSMDGTGNQAGLRAMLPAVANESVSITVKTGSMFAARFYPMLGNV